MKQHDFFEGNTFDAYTYFGAHMIFGGFVFRTLAPNAKSVSLLFRGEEIPMRRVDDGGIYEVTVAGALPGETYLYRITSRDGKEVDHCDPYGFGMELRPNFRSVLRCLDTFKFHDSLWMETRGGHRYKPINIYEVHLGSWCKKSDTADGWYRYDEIAPKLIAYVKKMGYTHIECMPLHEYPADSSWGYQATGFFSPTSRYGDAASLMQLIDTCHLAGIGVILDVVTVHFAVDDYGLAAYDGTPLYESPERKDRYSEWGSYRFDLSRGEVRSFLQSNAHYWLDVFHFDGLRFDAVSRIIYWGGDEARGINPSGVRFLQNLNDGIAERVPDAMRIAEDSSGYSGVTRRVSQGGLGFDYKWDLGWMHDTLRYFQLPPWARKENYHLLTFSMLYFQNETYLLALSHDENVHGKATVLQKMWGEYDKKFPQARTLYLYMYTHPGKKLLFMGSEFGQFREWDETRAQDFSLLRYPLHDTFRRYFYALNQIYRDEPALSAADYENGFVWIDCKSESRCIYAYERRSARSRLLIVLHLTDERTESYTVSLQDCRKLTPIFHTDWERFSGNTLENTAPLWGDITRRGVQFSLTLPPFSGTIFRIEEN